MERMHKSITTERIDRAIEHDRGGDTMPAFCLACGADQECKVGHEEHGECDVCGAPQVYTAHRLASSDQQMELDL